MRHVDLGDVELVVRDHCPPRVVMVVADDDAMGKAMFQHVGRIRADLLADDDIGSFAIDHCRERGHHRSTGVEVRSEHTHRRSRYRRYDRTMDVEIFEGPHQLAVAAADRIEAALERKGDGSDIGLAGGSTPQATYAELRSRRVDWGAVDVWLSDERWVPHDSEDSNGHQAERTLLEGIEPASFLRPRYSEHLEPVDSAAYYEASLRSVIGERPTLVLLGMGTDGHTASLFPETTAADDDSDRWFVANHVPKLDTWRLTVTPHLLTITEQIVVIVSGGAKADVLAEVVERPNGRYPIELLHRSSGTVTVLCDRDAAASLSS